MNCKIHLGGRKENIIHRRSTFPCLSWVQIYPVNCESDCPLPKLPDYTTWILQVAAGEASGQWAGTTAHAWLHYKWEQCNEAVRGPRRTTKKVTDPYLCGGDY